MKRIILLALLLGFITSGVNAQTGKGRWQVGAQVGNVSYQTQNGGRNFSGSIAPSGGYFVIDKLLIGTGIPLSYSTYGFSAAGQPRSTSTGYGLSPFARYYFGNGQLKPYAGISCGFSQSVTKRTQTDFTGQVVEQTDKGRTINLAPTIGVAYFITNNVALNAGFNYTIQTYKSEARDLNDNPVSYTSNWKSVSLGVGFQLFFGK